MQIRVLGMDPSLRNWGLAEGLLNLHTGELTLLDLQVVQPADPVGKQVRQNSKDLHLAEALATAALVAARRAEAIFVEVPVGSQSARAMASYGVCVGILGAIAAQGAPLIQVTPTEVKMAFVGNKEATKAQMIARAVSLYSSTLFPTHQGKIVASKAEHLADAIASIHAGVKTPLFQTILRMHTNKVPTT